MAGSTDWSSFPFDVLLPPSFPGELAELVDRVRPISMLPPYPWGYQLYGRLLTTHCRELEGDVIETGVGMGGLSVLLALLSKERGLGKQVISVDSFRGLPPPDERDNPYFHEGQYASHDDDQDHLVKFFWLTLLQYDVADVVEPVQGFFADVLPDLEPERRFCFAHVDGDLYDSVYCALDNLYDRVVDGGVIAVDDFFHPAQGPARAVSEFFNARGITPVLHVVFPYSVFILKGERASTGSRCLDGNVYSFDRLRSEPALEATVEASLARTTDPERRRACELFLELLRREPSYADIYDYWRALADWWEWIGPVKEELGEERLRATPLGAAPDG